MESTELKRLQGHKQEAFEKAIDSLARYKFTMFGYWAGIWVHLNKIDTYRESNPFRRLVVLAKKITNGEEEPCRHLSTTRYVGCAKRAYWICDNCEQVIGEKHIYEG